LAELCRDDDANAAFCLYLRSNDFHEAIMTLTEEGDVVLGLGLDDPWEDPAVTRQVSELLDRLMNEFNASAGIGGWELSPPQSLAEWSRDDLVMLRVGSF
jgi:hypothetical protein